MQNAGRRPRRRRRLHVHVTRDSTSEPSRVELTVDPLL